MSESAARRYRELAGRNTESVLRMRAHDRVLAEQLRERLAESERALLQSSERERVAKMGVRLHWEAAMEQLWNERWLAVQPPPQPADPAPEVDPLQCDAEVASTYAALHEALRRSSVLPRRSRHESD